MEKIINIVNKEYKDFEIWREKKVVRVVENTDDSNKEDFIASLNTAVRVFKDGKRGFIYISGESYDEDLILENLSFALKSSFEDEANVLPVPDIKDGQEFKTDLTEYDGRRLRNKIRPILEVRKEYPHIKKIERISVSGEEVDIEFYNSKAGLAKQKYQKYSLGVVVVVAKGDDEKIEWDYSISDDLKDLDEREIFKKAYQRGVKLLNSSPSNTGRFNILMESRSVCDFLEVFAKSFIGENLYKKKSLFDEQKIFSPLLNIFEDPFAKNGSIKVFFDGEGFITSKKNLLSDGKVVDFLYDNFYGIKLGKKSNGGSIRKNVIVPPQNGYTNIYIAPNQTGNISQRINETEELIVIVSLIGMHLVNPVTGEFSVGFDGYLLKKGEFVKSLSQSTISGNLKELFSNITEVGNDLTFYGNTGSPSILFSGISVSGV
ncbi:MAG: TldD/PmbA family protein [Proteobacteria bacterium]|nr:TldD/PmbA family protein [Pseudomonadota bacterium]